MRIRGRNGKAYGAARLLVGALTAALAIGLGGCGDDEPAPPTESAAAPQTTTDTPRPETGSEPSGDRDTGKSGKRTEERAKPKRDEPRVKAPEPARLAERAARRIYRDYIEAINNADGRRICELLAPGSIETLDPPRPRKGGSCVRSLEASIGFADPRGFPVWEETVLSGIDSVRATPTTAQITATIVTRFADREQPSIESDIAYAELAGGEWRLAKASGALYRAVGKPDIPPSVISPP